MTSPSLAFILLSALKSASLRANPLKQLLILIFFALLLHRGINTFLSNFKYIPVINSGDVQNPFENTD